MRFGVHLGNYGTGYSGESMIATARRAEQLGFDSVWVSDHVVSPVRIGSSLPRGARGRAFDTDIGEVCFEALVLLSVLAGSTERVRLGTSVLVAAQRNPVLLAKQLATLDNLSGGRLDLGLGGGWLAEEYAALGASFRGRWSRLEETIQILRLLWTEREAGFAGTDYAFDPVRMAPKPATPGGPRITIGGRSAHALRIAGRLADGLNAARLTPGEVAAALAQVRTHASEAGRDPLAVTALLRCDLPVTRSRQPDPEQPWVLAGPPEAVAETVAAYAASGTSELIVTVLPGERAAQEDALSWLAEGLRERSWT